MKLYDVVAERVSTYLLIIALQLSASVVFVDITWATAIVSRSVVYVSIYFYGRILRTLFRCELEVVVLGCHRKRHCAHEDRKK